MTPPLTSLCPVDWAVWADWSADHDRPKAERFARKTAKSLRKLLAVGAEVRMYLGLPTRIVTDDSWYGSDVRYSTGIINGDIDVSECLTSGGHSRMNQKYQKQGYWFLWDQLHWVTARRLKTVGYQTKGVLLSPADFPVEHQQGRLAWKFWKVVNRRATGVPDGVLEVVDDTGSDLRG